MDRIREENSRCHGEQRIGIDLPVGGAGESLVMRFGAWAAVASMLLALVSGPFFHVHDQDEHGHAGSFVHAHLPEPENPTAHSGEEVEAGHSHEHVRWLDVFTVSAPATTAYLPVSEFSEPLTILPPAENRAVASVQTLRAHSPPLLPDLPPRAPPTL
jgi:hypothetical protein